MVVSLFSTKFSKLTFERNVQQSVTGIYLLIIDFVFSLESNAVDDSLPWDATLTLGSVSITVKGFNVIFIIFDIFVASTPLPYVPMC